MAHWITNTQLFQSMASNVKASAAFTPPVPSVFGKMRNTLMRPIQRYLLLPIQRALGKTVQPATDVYKQFTGDYLIQKWVTTISFAVIVLISVLGTAKKQIGGRTTLQGVYPRRKSTAALARATGWLCNER
jgi:hypothetical protein